jgi:hypothetical protein
MSSATLSKFTVPLDGSQPQGMLHPKLKYRFRVTFENFGAKGTATTELTKQVVSFARPTVQFEAIELPTYNSRIYVAGRHAWQTVATTLRDDATGQVSKLIGQQVQKQFDFFEMSSAAAGIDYKFMTRFQMLDGGNGNNAPTVLEEWELYGCYLENVNYQEMNYGTNEAMTIQMTIKFDNANQKGANAGIGSAVTRTIGTNATGVGS